MCDGNLEQLVLSIYWLPTLELKDSSKCLHQLSIFLALGVFSLFRWGSYSGQASFKLKP